MDTKVEFLQTDWDDKQEISTLHLSCLVQTLLPLHIIKWESTKRHYENIKRQLEKSVDEIMTFIVTGSMAEGYSIPPSIYRSATIGVPDVEVLSDVDTLWVSSQLKVLTEECSHPDSAEYKAYFEYSKESPGYVRVCLLSTKTDDDTFIYDKSNGKHYLSGTKYTDKMFAALSDLELVTRQGPAISMIDDNLSNGSIFSVRGGISKDIVLALPCYPWPKVASGWKERVQKSPWLRTEIVDSVISEGCHVVGVPSKSSDTPDIEWRLSFSAQEGKLAREAVTDYQRQCFIYIKILHYQKIKPKGILSSYVFKSVFLHCCEKLQVTFWKDYPGSCILYILDNVLDCLRNKHVPTYFLPENNLIGHLSEEEIEQVIADVEDIRKDPITPVLEFTDRRLFSHHCIYITFREMVEPLLSDMSAFKEHRNKETSILKGVIATGYRICHFLIAEESSNEEAAMFKHQEAVRCLIDIYTLWLQPMNINATLEEFLDKAGLAVKDPHLCLVFFEAAVSLETEYPELSRLKGTLARLYNKAAHSKSSANYRSQEYTSKAEVLFKHVFEKQKNSVIDYTLFFLKQERISEAKNILEDFLLCNEQGEVAKPYVIDMTDLEYLMEPLKTDIETHGKLTSDTVTLALYFLLRCLSSYDDEGSKHKFEITLQNLEDFARNRNDGNTKRLLNLVKSPEHQEHHISSPSFLYKYCTIL